MSDAVNGRTYEPNPRYGPVDGEVARGWRAALATLASESVVVAVDGPAAAGWDAVRDGLLRASDELGLEARQHDVRRHLRPWREIVARTASKDLPDDPDFTTLSDAGMADLFGPLPTIPSGDGITFVTGPGAALVGHDVLWYADLPKRHAEAAVGAGSGPNLGQTAGAARGTTRRLFYVDWPILDRHRDAIAPGIQRWIDLQDPADPTSIDGATLRTTMSDLAGRPFRTRPTFNTAPWGGHWGQRRLGHSPDAVNTAIGYELIAPESGVLIGDAAAAVEVPFALITAHCPNEILGEAVHVEFGTSFPVRFDYLDTVGGGNLSVHCHPQAEYMRRIFGWQYTQHESYYVMVGGPGRHVYLGLRDDVDLAAFEREARAAAEEHIPFDIERFVQTFAADQHRLFMIPAGTPHGSGQGNVILEVSATPYLYSLRFYDWLRRDGDGRQRPVHVDHAFANLDPHRHGEQVPADLIQPARRLREGPGWHEELLGALPNVFFEVRRVVLDDDVASQDDTDGRFHVLNVVEGDGVVVVPATGPPHPLSYAETIVVPAAVGPYRLKRVGSERVRVVKSLVR